MDDSSRPSSATAGTGRPLCPVLVADYFIANASGPLTPLQVIKMVYIAHGYSLAILGEPLVEEAVEAWRYGPVIPSVYHNAKKYGGGRITELLYSGISTADTTGMGRAKEFVMDQVSPRQVDILDGVLEVYGGFTGIELTNMTHVNDSPWKRYYKEGVAGRQIPNDAIKDHYKELIKNRGA